MNGPGSRDTDLVSFVGVFNPGKVETSTVLGPTDLEAIEEQLGEAIQLGGTSGRGGGSVLAIPRRQVELLILENRIEVRTHQPTFSPDVAHQMVSFFRGVASRIPELPWEQVGYNFLLRVEAGTSAAQKLGNTVLKPELEKAVGHRVLGGAGWLWLEMPDTTLWLKLQPHRDSTTTRQIRVNANFQGTLENASEFPASEVIEARLVSYHKELDSVLRALEL